MEEEIKTKIYEAAFIVKDAEGEAVCEKLLREANATILEKRGFVATKLAYPIKRQESGFFGVFQFEAIPSSIQALRGKADLAPEILRFLVITPPIGASKPEVVESRSAEKPLPREEAIKPSGSNEALSNEALEETLEKILQ